MKILFVIDSFGSGGAQRLFVNIVNGLSASHNSTVFLYNANSNFFQNDLLPNIQIHREEQRLKSGFNFRVLWKLKALMSDADVVISFLPTANIYCLMAGIISRKAKRISCEMSVVNKAESKIRRLAANLANFFAHHVVCNSFTQGGYIRALPGMTKRVSVIWNGCADLPFIARPMRYASSFSLVVIGRVAYPKNGVRLLQALQLFFERNGFVPEVRWAGREDVDGRARLMKQQMLDFLMMHPAVNEKFQFIGEISDVSKLYADADAMILPSIYEGVPVVICEAMLNGCPVVATDISDNRQILGANEERGILCDPLSPIDICKAMERRYDMSAETLESMVLDARRFAEEYFSLSKMIDGYRQVIEVVNC